jgi:hypothetical protein
MMDLLVVLNFYLNAVMFRGQAFFCACSIYLPRQISVAFKIKDVYLDSVSIGVEKRGDGMRVIDGHTYVAGPAIINNDKETPCHTQRGRR